MRYGQRFNPRDVKLSGCMVPNVLLECSDLPMTAKVLWARLAQHMGRGGRVYPRQETLAKELGVSTRQIIALLARLVDDKYLEVDRPNGVDRLVHKTNEYHFLWHPSLTGKRINSHVNQSWRPGVNSNAPPGVKSTSPPILPYTKEEEYTTVFETSASADVPRQRPTAEQARPNGVGTARPLIAMFQRGWEAKYGARYPWAKKDSGLARTIAKAAHYQTPVLESIVQRYLSCDVPFYSDSKHPLGLLAGNLPRFMAEPAPPLEERWVREGDRFAAAILHDTGTRANAAEAGVLLKECNNWVGCLRGRLREELDRLARRRERQRAARGMVTISTTDVQPGTLEMFTPAGQSFHAQYQTWIIGEVDGWSGWEGGLREFRVGGRHWVRWLRWYVQQNDGALNRREREIIDATSASG